MAEPRISIELSEAGDGWSALVHIDDGGSQTTHRVTLRHETYSAITSGAVSAEQLVLVSFRFLLDREPKESILPEFDLDVIERYFPEYRREISAYFEAQA